MFSSTTSIQLETIFTLMLNRRSEDEIAKATGYDRDLVRQAIKANRRKFEERLFRHRKHLSLQSQKDRIREAEIMIDAIRKYHLGFKPLYEQPEPAKCRHIQVSIEKTKQKKSKQYQKTKQLSIMEHMLNYGNRTSH